MKQLFVFLIAASIGLAQTPAPKATPAKAATAKTTPAKAKTPAPDLLNPSTLKARAPAVYRVRLNTTKGEVILEITRAWAPIGADRFYNLVRGGFFTNLAIFRVVRSPQPFMAQFGISPRPEVNRAWQNQTILDDRPTQSNKRGTITFAATGAPNSRGTQLFINYADNVFLDSMGFAPIGAVIQGMENVDKFYAGYGENGPDQGQFMAQGRAYTDKAFPMLDHIIAATIVPIPAPAATPAPAANKK
ncbi:MAG TPA: peptidylprolyl isomerase [Bryobacteraceae bacterium]|jgi:peptidyl-prolyl cis-trans isomerase A (cyclophilin A)